MTLHTVNKSPESPQALRSCLRMVLPGDSVLLIEDGVYAVMHHTLLESIDPTVKLCALKTDILARGLSAEVHGRVELVEFTRFVELSCTHRNTVSWF